VRYEKAIALEKDHVYEINYAITLYNRGDLEKSKQHLNEFERLFTALDEETKNSDSDVLEKRQQLLSVFASV
jgi:rubrerythrin